VIGSQLRPVVGRLFDPVVNLLLRLGVSPDVVTLTGTLGVVVAASWFFPRGDFLVGAFVITFFVLTDTIDGALARKKGISGPFGGWLDSTCDRVADGAIFGAIAFYYARQDDGTLLTVSLFVLVASLVVSYEKARAEGLGLTCNVGIAERPERLIVVLVATGFTGFGVPEELLAGAMWLLAVLSAATVVQRALEVRRQATA
jgi:CDP-diacylglycerol--glycerol-3-phosphate 3-phosphatidyltransferase